MKNLIYLLLLLFIASCNSSKPAIITSKSEAIKKRQYDASNVNNVKKVRVTPESKVVLKPEKKKKNTVVNNDDETDIVIENSSYLADQIIESAKENIGVRYKMGGTSKAGFDCSGLLYVTFEKYEIVLPRTSYQMSQTGLEVEKYEAKKGDLIFFATSGRGIINHVGMIVEANENDIKFIHASTSNGVMISSLNESYFSRAFKKIKRVLE